MQIVIEIPEDKITSKQCYKEVLIKFVDKQVCEVTMIGQIPREDDTGLFFDVLPEGHGDLIDRNKIEYYTDCNGCYGSELGHCCDCLEEKTIAYIDDISNLDVLVQAEKG